MAKLLTIGLDGATFDLMLPWAQSGELPHIAQLLSQGVQGKIQSTIPPMSPSAWNSFMTGKNPGKHAIFDYTERKPQSYEACFINASWRKATPFWHHLGGCGKRVAMISVPFTYPPEKVNGAMISGMDAPGVSGNIDRSAVYPPELCDEISAQIGEYPMGANLFAYTDPEEMLEATLRTMEQKAATALYLYAKEEWDFFLFILGELDAVSHRFWKFCDPSSPLNNGTTPSPKMARSLLTIYQKADEIIGRFLKQAPKETTVMVISDHGNGGMSNKAVYLNRWLEKMDLLQFKTAKGLASTGLNAAKKLALKILPPQIKRMVYRLTNIPNRVESWVRFSAIQWTKTAAYSEETPYYPSIWINLKGREPLGIVEPSEYVAVCEQIRQKLMAWQDPYTGTNVVKNVYRREEVYSGPHVSHAPDLIIDWNLPEGRSYIFKQSAGQKRPPVYQLGAEEGGKGKSGDHRDEGIFLAVGPQIGRSREIKDAHIMDLAPTILYLMGMPVPRDMDGKVLTQIFNEEYLASHPIQQSDLVQQKEEVPTTGRGYSADEQASIQERLKGLGYME